MSSSNQRSTVITIAEAAQESATPMKTRITIPEIADRLRVGRTMVYEMLERSIIPGIRVGRRWIVTRYAYEQWEKTCGMPAAHPATPLTAQFD